MLISIPNTTYLKIHPIAGESFGVRGFCFMVKTPDLSMILDPGCALGPRKGFKIPHPLEFNQLRKLTNSIIDHSKQCDYLFISHFHHDHFKPKINDNFYIYSNSQIFDSIYEKKYILTKNHEENINRNQQKRGFKFYGDIKSINCTAFRTKSEDFKTNRISDEENNLITQLYQDKLINNALQIGETILLFPNEVLHGERRDGKKILTQPLIMVYKSEAFYFFADVQGMATESDFYNLLKIKKELSRIFYPNMRFTKKFTNIIALGGLRELNQRSHNNTLRIIEDFDITILDHHLIRNRDFHKIWNDYLQRSNEFNTTLTPMNLNFQFKKHQHEYIGSKTHVLECFREELFEKYPPSEEFKKWSRIAQKRYTIEESPSK